jgi:hypothetical protein
MTLVPPLAGTRTFARAFSGLLLFELAALCGEWLVHQIEYLIVYGPRFQAVMQTTPHRYYMTGLGSLLGLAGIAALATCLLILHGRRHATNLLLSRLPARLCRLIRPASLQLPWRAVLTTALLLMACQVAVYTLQENLEWVYAGLGVPGIWVLLGPSHLTVLPLHALVALCGSGILWTLSALSRRSGTVLDTVRAMARRRAARSPITRSVRPPADCLPHRRLLPAARGLRSPPLAA